MRLHKILDRPEKRVLGPALLSSLILPPTEAFLVLNADPCSNRNERAAAHAFYIAFATAPFQTVDQSNGLRQFDESFGQTFSKVCEVKGE